MIWNYFRSMMEILNDPENGTSDDKLRNKIYSRKLHFLSNYSINICLMTSSITRMGLIVSRLFLIYYLCSNTITDTELDQYTTALQVMNRAGPGGFRWIRITDHKRKLIINKICFPELRLSTSCPCLPEEMP